MRLLLPSCLLLAACGGAHPLAGNWERLDPAATGSLLLMFDRDSDKVMACRIQPDGSDTDMHGSWRIEDGKVRITGNWDDGIVAEWTGELAGDRLELSIEAQSTVFQRVKQ